MDLNNVPPAQVDRIANRVNDAKHNSYALNLPVKALSERGGGSPDNTRDKRGAHVQLLADESFLSLVHDFIFKEVAPWLLTEKTNLDEALAAAARTKCKKEKGKRKLFAAQGSFNAVLFVLVTAVAAAAARPRDKNGKVMEYELYMAAFFPSHPVYQLSFFSVANEAFARIRGIVRTAEDAEIGRVTATAAAAAASPILQRVREELGPIQAQQGVLEKKVDAMLSILVEMKASASALPVSEQAAATATPTVTVVGQSTAAAEQWPIVTEHHEDPVESTSTSASTRRRRDSVIVYSEGHVRMKELKFYPDAQSIFDDCFTGLNGTKSIKALEAEGTSWRSYDNGRKRFHELSFFIRFLERQAALPGSSHAAAVLELQRRVDTLGSCGRSTCPNWHGLIKQLNQEPEEQARKRPRRSSSVDTSAPSAAPWAEEDVPIEGAYALEEDPHLHGHVATSQGL